MMKWPVKGVNDMKKIVNIFLVLMLMASIISLAFAVEADNNNQGNPGNQDGNYNHPFDNETEREIRIMNNSLGARIRLLQLEKAILTNLLKGTLTVQVLKGLNVSTTKLEAILENLSDALDTVRVTDPTANNSVEVFVQLKNESRNLTRQFRDTLRMLLDDETIAMIKGQLKNITSDELQNCSINLRHWIRHFNSNQLYRLYGIIGETNLTLIKEYINGNITLNQTKLQLYKMINQMTKEKQYQIFHDVKEENIRREIQAHESFNEIQHHGKGNGPGRQH
ncbi:Uncharacterised protein [uncultured archaeon]|nr:Uncharacterised protein [uncultured archaeon]